jgi:signal transduction histidine kinase
MKPTKFVNAVIAAFLVVSLGFLASTVFALATSENLSGTELVDQDALPSIRYLEATRTHAHNLERANTNSDRHEVAVHRSRLEAAFRDYESTPAFVDERPLVVEARRTLHELDEAIHESHGVPEVVARLDAQLATLADLNLSASSALIRHTSRERAAAVKKAVVADALALAVAIAAAAAVVAAFRRHRRLEVVHERVLSERADELATFSDRVAHDLVSPLAATSLSIQTALRKTDDTEGRRLALERALRATRRVQALVRGLLAFARAGARPTPGSRASLRLVVDGAVEEQLAQPTTAGIQIGIDDVPDLDVACSAGVLASVVSNLIGNAVKYTMEAPTRRITVRSRKTDGSLRCEIEDTGPGIPEELLDSVFLPYVRANERHTGLGLGLATVKKLVEAHGGRVGVRSHVGHGSTFWFELPLAPPPTADVSVSDTTTTIPAEA